jgi:hypothetical protein
MIAGSMAAMGSNNACLYGEPVLALGPEHAAILARDGLSKDDIRRYLCANPAHAVNFAVLRDGRARAASRNRRIRIARPLGWASATTWRVSSPRS